MSKQKRDAILFSSAPTYSSRFTALSLFLFVGSIFYAMTQFDKSMMHDFEGSAGGLIVLAGGVFLAYFTFGTLFLDKLVMRESGIVWWRHGWRRSAQWHEVGTFGRRVTRGSRHAPIQEWGLYLHGRGFLSLSHYHKTWDIKSKDKLINSEIGVVLKEHAPQVLG